ncbi:coiled-coil domain-containing protein 12 [Pycnococcus provasolii]
MTCPPPPPPSQYPPLFQRIVMEAAESRRARLLALRADAQKVRIQQNEPLATPSESGGGAAQTAHHGDRAADDNETPVVHFRNYVPRSHEGDGGAGARGGGADGGVLETQVARVPAAAPPPPTAMPSVPPPAAAAAANDVPLPSDIPTKPNADLRREVAKQLAKLERRTQRALVEISVEEERMRGAEAASLGR